MRPLPFGDSPSGETGRLQRNVSRAVPHCQLPGFCKDCAVTPSRRSFSRAALEKRKPLRVLQVHNKYRPGWGGEDTVADLEADLLRRNGHQVQCLSAWTGELDGAGPLRLLAAGIGAVWSRRGYAAMQRAIAGFLPDIVHVHNEFPLFSPSIFWACGRAGVPVVQTMHNFRFTCPNALLFRQDRPCEQCVARFPWPALRHRCYGSSFFRTAAVAARNVVHRWLGTYRNKVHAYIALTEFSKELLVWAGLPEARVFVKPNFQALSEKLVAPRLPQFVFAGWMTRAKGLHLLLQAWQEIHPAGHRLLLMGDGPERASLQRLTADNSSIVWCGPQPREKVIEAGATSRYAVMTSLVYENFPMSVLEALSAGTPPIVPNHGAFPVMVSDGREGLRFAAGDAASLAATLRVALSAPEHVWMKWSGNARNKYLREYTAEINYAQLLAVYERAIAFSQARRKSHAYLTPAKSGATASDPLRGNS